MRVGISTASLAAGDLDQGFALAAKAKADGLEVVYQATAAKDLEHWAEAAEGLKSLSAKHALPIAALNLAVLCNSPALVESGEAASRSQQLVRDALTVAAAAGAELVLLPFLGRNAIETQDRLDRAAESLAELADAAEEAGVVLGIETTLNLDQQQFLLDHLGGSAFAKICYNTGEALARKLDAATGIRDLGGKQISHVHLKDVRLAEGQPPDFDIHLGEGNVDFRAVVQALRAVAFGGWVIVETPPGKNPAASARKNIQFATELLAAS